MSKVFFTADTHFGHGNIIKYCHRPFLTDRDKEALKENGGRWHEGSWKGEFASNWKLTRDAVDMMNDHITDQINAIVGEDDTLWHLGDWCFANKQDYYRKARFYRDRLKCQNINIIWGNHDDRSIRDIFDKSYDMYQITVDGQKIVLCHYAMAIFDKSHRGAWQLYGHSHSGAEPWMDKHMPERRSMDVGVDNIKKLFGEYRPISFEEIMKIMSKKKGHFMDHHVDRNAPTEEELMEKG